MTAVESLLVVRGQALMEGSTPDRTRTCDLRFRKPTLYPPELRGRVLSVHFDRLILTVSPPIASRRVT